MPTRARVAAGAAVLLMAGVLMSGARGQPASPVRVVAEWEPALGTLISWPLELPQALVVELARDDRLYVLVTGSAAESQARATFSSWGLDAGRIEYIHTSVQTEWTRDWGPHQIFDGHGQWAIVDPIFRGYPWVDTPCVPITSPGGYAGDDAVNVDVAAYFGAPLHSLPAYLTGGNFLVDGHHAAFSTCAMVGENNQLWTEAEFRGLAEQWLGVADYHVVDNTEDHGIQHIDCWFKVLDEETLLVKRPPTWHEEYPRIEQNLQMLAAATSVYGRPYRILRIDCPAYDGQRIAAYTNALILNGKVYVPLFSIPGDAQALQTWSAALPGYEVHGFPWSNWYYYDALHCRTRAIFDRYMLRVTHRRLVAEVPAASGHEIVAWIDDRSGAGLVADALRVYWRSAGAPDWGWVPLAASGGPDEYVATLPGQPVGTAVEYYIAAADLSGRSETLPRTAPAGCYRFTVVEAGLRITVANPPAVVAPWTLTSFGVTIDPQGEELVPGTARLHYGVNGLFAEVALEHVGADEYQATLPYAVCEDGPPFYVSAEGSETGLKTAPPGAPATVYTAAVGQFALVPFYEERFEAGLPVGWSASGLWHVATGCTVSPPCDGARWAYYGQDSTCTYNTGARNSGVLRSAAVVLPEVPEGGQVRLTYCTLLQTENEPGYDVSGLYANGVLVDTAAESSVWQTRAVELTAWAGEALELEWQFDTIDHHYNNYRGWQVDAVTLAASEFGCDFASPPAPGDADCSGALDVGDVEPFLRAFDSEAGHALAYATCHWRTADLDGDGDVDLHDAAGWQVLWGVE